MKIYIIMSIITFICLSLYYSKRDAEFLNSNDDYECMFIEVAIESIMWVVCVPVTIFFGIIHSISTIDREYQKLKRRSDSND